MVPCPQSERCGATCFTPKALSELHYVRRDESRPVTLVNITYKFIATLCNTHLSAALPAHIDDRQRGFAKGRLGTDRVLEFEVVAYAFAVQGATAPAAILLDVEAVFSSLSHSFIYQCIRKFGGTHPSSR